MRIAAIAALCAAPVMAFAQVHGGAPGPASPMPGSSNPQSAPAATTPRADTGSTANTTAQESAPTAPVAAGLKVKDNTGAEIGSIADVKADASGKSMATIKMGTKSFQVPAANLAVQNGAAVINLTKAQIDAQLPKS
jgi:hypothetical protein